MLHATPTAIPVTLLTGFLGSGKTTLLNALLADPAMGDSAVIVNEFGSVAIDHDLVRTGSETSMITSTGCLCCTASSDIRTSLYELHMEQRRGTVPPFRRIVVETTGLADPAPIINSLIPGGAPVFGLRDHTVARAFRLANVVCTVDAEHGPEALDAYFECWKQVVFADHIVLTKTDLVTADEATSQIRGANPTARIDDRNRPCFDPAALAGTGFYAPSHQPEDVLGWLALERLTETPPADHGHDLDRHGAGIEALALFHDEPLDPRAVDAFLEIMTGQFHVGLLRLKGIFALADDPGRPLVAHAVQHRLYPPIRLEYWPSADVRSRVMIIGDGIPLQPIRQMFEALRAKRLFRRRLGKT